MCHCWPPFRYAPIAIPFAFFAGLRGHSRWGEGEMSLNGSVSVSLSVGEGVEGGSPKTAVGSARCIVPFIRLRNMGAVSYTHLRAHETDSYLVCRLLLEK